MKIYTAKYDANRPSAKAITVPLNSNYGIGIEVTYNSKTIPLTKEYLTVDGEQPDNIINNMAIFNKTSSSEPTREIHEVKFGYDTDVVWGEYKKEWAGNKATIRDDIPQFTGAKFYAPKTVQTSITDVFATPFAIGAYKADGTSPTVGYPFVYVYSHDILYPGLDPNWGTPVLQMIVNKTGSSSWEVTWSVPNKTYTGWVAIEEGDEVIIPENSYIYANASMQASVQRLAMDTKWKEHIEGTFNLFTDSKNLGVVEGYGQNYIFKNTVTLSGTSADDTEFNYTIPTP